MTKAAVSEWKTSTVGKYYMLLLFIYYKVSFSPGKYCKFISTRFQINVDVGE